MTWAAAVSGQTARSCKAAAATQPLGRKGCWGGKRPLAMPTAPLHILETPDAISLVNTASTNAATAHHSSHLSGQFHELEYPSLGSCSSSSSSNSSSRAASISTSVDCPTSLSTFSSTASGTAQQTRRTGKHRRFCSAKNSPQAAAIQRTLAEGAHKHHESAQQVAAKRWQALQLQRGIVQTRMVIGAAQLGNCAGLSSHRYAQTEALESLLKEHNPARYTAAFNTHSCIADEERAQLIIQKAPQLQVPFGAVQQLGRFEDMADSRQICHLVRAQMAAALVEAAEQAAVKKRKQSAEASYKENDLRIASAAAAAGAAQCVLDALLLQFESVTAQTEAQTKAQPEAQTEAQTPAQTEAQTPAQTAAQTEAQAEARPDSASHADAVTEAQTDNATTAADKSAREPSHSSDIPLPLAPLDEGSMSAVEQLVSAASDLSEAEYLADSDQSSCGTSQPDSLDSEVSEPLPAITEDDIKFLHQITNKKCNTAYGMHAERPTASELNSETAGQQLWFKMGAPDNRPLGSFGGVEFELGCQIDGALLQGSSAVPTEVKNRVNRCPRHLPKHELVQVQCQLQLSEVTKGLLIERLDHRNGLVETEQHTIHRDDFWWDEEIMPALTAFLKVFSSIAADETQLNLYLNARKEKRHESYLKHLVRQQLN
ncbi:TPA: hypothetical protein ACH3X1_004054 [Trebouxia sp. C0004]